MQFFRDIYFDSKYLIEELVLLIKHPTRKASREDVSYHWYKLWDHIIFHPWYCLKRGVRNLVVWAPLIWRNDTWDARFLQDLTYKQLVEMETLWEKIYVPKERKWRNEDNKPERGYRCQYTRSWKRIRWSRRLLELFFEEHYATIAYDEHKNAFPNGRDIFKHDPEDITYDTYGVPILYACKPMLEDEANDYRTRSAIAIEKDKKVWKLYCKNMSYQRNWWD